MDPIYWFSLFFNLLAIGSVVIGFWISRRVLPAVITWLQNHGCSNLLARPAARILLWLALAALFTLPMLDVIGFLGNLANVVFMPSKGGGISTLLGIVPVSVYFIFPLVLMLVVYGVVIFLSKEYITTPGQFDQIERFFIVFSVAGLAYLGTYNIFSQIFSVQIQLNQSQPNYGTAGFILEVLIGIVILFVMMTGIDKMLAKR